MELSVFIVFITYPDKSKYVAGVFKSYESAESFVSFCHSKRSSNSESVYKIYSYPVFD